MSNVNDDKRQQGVDGNWICVGAFAGKHGVRGHIKLRTFTDDPLAIFDFQQVHLGADGKAIQLKKKNQTKNGYTVQLDGVTTPEAAQALNGSKLFVPRSALSEHDENAADGDEYFLADLIGLKVLSLKGDPLGHVRSVENFGAEDLIEINLFDPVKGLGQFVFVPFRVALVPVVGIKAGTISVDMDAWLALQETVESADNSEAELDD